MKKLFKTVMILAVAAAITTGAYLHFRPTTVAAAATVSTATVAKGSLSATVTGAGNIQAQQTADLTFGQSGTVKKINVKVGDSVKAGDVLGELDAADLTLQLRSAQVNFKNAQDTLTQAQNDLATLLAGSDANTLDIAQNGVETAQIALDQVQLKLEQAKSPGPMTSPCRARIPCSRAPRR